MKPAPERALPVYTVNEPGCVSADRVVAAVTAPPTGLPQGIAETLASKCQTPPRTGITGMETLLQHLLPGKPARHRCHGWVRLVETGLR